MLWTDRRTGKVVDTQPRCTRRGCGRSISMTPNGWRHDDVGEDDHMAVAPENLRLKKPKGAFKK